MNICTVFGLFFLMQVMLGSVFAAEPNFSDPSNYYAVLGLSKDATKGQIRARYKKLAVQYHPDKEGSNEQFVMIHKAYEKLLNPDDHDDGKSYDELEKAILSNKFMDVVRLTEPQNVSLYEKTGSHYILFAYSFMAALEEHDILIGVDSSLIEILNHLIKTFGISDELGNFMFDCLQRFASAKQDAWAHIWGYILLRDIIPNAGKQINEKVHSFTPLHFIAQFFRESSNWSGQIMEKLIKQGAQIEAIVDSDGQTPLHCAAENGQTSAIKILLDRGANINAQENEGRTSLHLAILGMYEAAGMSGKDNVTPVRRRETVALLLERGADRSIADKKGQTALACAQAKVARMKAGGKTVTAFEKIVELLQKGQAAESKSSKGKGQKSTGEPGSTPGAQAKPQEPMLSLLQALKLKVLHLLGAVAGK
ncbi:MAG: ankyrin repeat domain-containing protein [Epsilonproteobacteria bacterium]|nr:ankyrin repeat domain-containing protein [Campylobacterota bacterium]